MFELVLDCSLRRICTAVVLAVALLGGATVNGEDDAVAQPLKAILSGEIPVNVSQLLAMQQHVQSLTTELVATTVAVRVGPAHGSGVIISADGYVLTAAHVAGRPNQEASIILHDGRLVNGKTLGIFRTLDAGLIRITTNRSGNPWPHAEMGDSDDASPGQWCLATGHPGGFQNGRRPVVRLGRILSVKNDSTIHTDCTLIGGDSGGPLFDMQGHVIGIHSRIGGRLNVNLHVPVNTYRQQWDRLARSDSWGHMPGTRPYIGVHGEEASKTAKIVEVRRGTPADKAGIKKGDIVIRFAGKQVTDFDSLISHVADEQPGSLVRIEVLRNGQRKLLELVIGDAED